MSQTTKSHPAEAKPFKLEQDNTFQANGKTYKLRESLPLGDYMKLEKLRFKAKYGEGLNDFITLADKCWEKLNGLQFADGVAILQNIKDMGEEIKKRASHPLLLIGTLFVYDANATKWEWTEDVGIKILNDLIAEGYDVSDFFFFASAWLNDFSKKLKGKTLDSKLDLQSYKIQKNGSD